MHPKSLRTESLLPGLHVRWDPHKKEMYSQLSHCRVLALCTALWLLRCSCNIHQRDPGIGCVNRSAVLIILKSWFQLPLSLLSLKHSDSSQFTN